MKRLGLVGLLILFTIFVVLLFIPKNTTSPFQHILGPTPTVFPTQSPLSSVLKNLSLSDIVPGKTTEMDVQNMLSGDGEATTSGEATIFSFPTSSSFRKNRVFTQAGSAFLIVEEITEDNSLYKDFLSKNPPPPVVFSDIHSLKSLYLWFIFPEDGVGFFANKETGYTTNVQRFSPMSKETYLNTVAKTLSLTEGEVPTVTEEDEGID